MKKIIKGCLQWVIICTILLIGVIAFMVVMGDEDPEAPMSLLNFFLIKSAGCIVIYVCYLIVKNLYKRGFLPTYFYDLMLEED